MRAEYWARGIGWVSLGLAATAAVAPDLLGRAVGIGERRPLIRALGARDLIIGSGLVLAPDPGPWMRARLVSEIFDVALHGGVGLLAPFHRGRAVTVAGLAAVFALADWKILRSLQQR